MKNISIISSGFLPVPASKGGAVENLIENVIKKNEIENKFNLIIFSIFDENAKNMCMKYKKSKFIFIKSNIFVDFLDEIIFFVAKFILKKKNSQSYRFIIRRLHYLNNVSKYLKKYDYDKIILENHPTQYLALKWRKNYIKYSNKYYYHCHNEFPSNYGCTDIINKTEKFICVSKYIANTLKKYLNLDSSKFIVLRNGISQENFKKKLTEDKKNKIKKEYNIEFNEKVLLFTGRITPEKGVKELLDALMNVNNSMYKLIIVGSSLNDVKNKTKYERDIEKNIKKLNDKVIFVGFIKYEEIYKLYQIADIAILPSIWNDPAPLTVIESLTCGLPIITTNSGGIPEYAVNGSAIILERNENLVKELSENINLLLSDENKRKAMRKCSIDAAKKLNIDQYYRDFEAIINE